MVQLTIPAGLEQVLPPRLAAAEGSLPGVEGLGVARTRSGNVCALCQAPQATNSRSVSPSSRLDAGETSPSRNATTY